ncbi:hypothetical protein FB45DRAFT_730819 [Roridomyces roridus]|uniref:Uncharacterized protein n=1 Tax=Roridomyces roridus TaxID=1738132 RepID=A0AAD7CHY1_9AGAR|nr:hypothetical protein FB45DRAFT_730819 [Roridomyces roridus]
MELAVQYVQKVKQRCDPETYRQFLDILSRWHLKPDTIDEEEVSLGSRPTTSLDPASTSSEAAGKLEPVTAQSRQA